MGETATSMTFSGASNPTEVLPLEYSWYAELPNNEPVRALHYGCEAKQMLIELANQFEGNNEKGQ